MLLFFRKFTSHENFYQRILGYGSSLFIVQAHWNKSPRVDMSLYSDTLSSNLRSTAFYADLFNHYHRCGLALYICRTCPRHVRDSDCHLCHSFTEIRKCSYIANTTITHKYITVHFPGLIQARKRRIYMKHLSYYKSPVKKNSGDYFMTCGIVFWVFRKTFIYLEPSEMWHIPKTPSQVICK